jgi:chemotaxis methyl-accepting protein methylase
MHRTDLAIREILHRCHGIDAKSFDAVFFHAALLRRMSAVDCATPEEYGRLLETSAEEARHLHERLTIHHSEFMRNPLTFAVLEKIVFPALVQKKRAEGKKELRVWSAACAAGQEAYSVAMLLEEHVAAAEHGLQYRIFATDQDETQIALAQKGRYAASAVQNLTVRQLARWFTRSGSMYTIDAVLQTRLEISVFNLLDDHLQVPPASIFGNFDVVLCANLLYYYADDAQEHILNKVARSLAPGGFLVTGEAERAMLFRHCYQEIAPLSAVFRL